MGGCAAQTSRRRHVEETQGRGQGASTVSTELHAWAEQIGVKQPADDLDTRSGDVPAVQ
jgi:hypothetical protein